MGFPAYRLLSITLPFLGIITAANAGLVGHWKLDDTAGSSSVVDSSGNGNTANQAGGGAGLTLGAAGVQDTSSSFNGAGFWVTANNPEFQSSNFTVSFWMKADPQTATWRTAVSNRSGEDGLIFYREQNSNRMQFWMKGPGGTGNWNVQSAPVITDFDKWYHVVGTYDNATQEKKFYFHGQGDAWGTSIQSATTTGPYFAASGQLGIGARGAGGALPWGGGTNEQLLDEVQYYNEALSDAQVQFLFENPGARIPEPSGAVLVLGGLFGLAALRRRRLL